jgi:hypothetical protein
MIIERNSIIVGVVTGAAYGLLLRVAMGNHTGVLQSLFGLMTLAFLFLVPFILGVMTVIGWPAAVRRSKSTAMADLHRPPLRIALVLPWLSVVVCLTAMVAMKLEGLICTIVVLPVFLAMSTLGGLFGYWLRRKEKPNVASGIALMLLPLMMAPVEKQFDAPTSMRDVTTSIRIAAPRDVVWKNIADVPLIAPNERPWRASSLIGIPDPIEATLAQKRVGGVRQARFARGIRFDEVVTEYRPLQSLAFDIHANTDEIPPTTLDEHVLVGGPYFDVLHGSFELQPIGDNETLLILRSRHRLTTHFNAYAGLWSDWIMRDVQNTLLKIIEKRCISS